MTADTLFPGGGEMGARIRQLDWSRTLLGPVATWPVSLRTAVGIMLGSRFPMMVHWGPELVHFYNDGYATILQEKHPGALGQPAQPWWSEMWPFLLDIFQPVLAGQTTYFENDLVLPNRQGFVEEAYFTFSHSPIYDEAGQVGGIFVTALETTATVLQQRRLALLSHLTAHTSLPTGPAEVAQHLMAALATNIADLPFALLYAHEAGAPVAQLQAWYGLPADAPTAPATLPVALPSSPTSWPLAEVLHDGQPRLVEQLPARFVNWPAGAVATVPTRALLFPLAALPSSHTRFVLLLGLSARLAVDAAYESFLTLVADYAGRALARATALDDARRLAHSLQGANAFLESFVHIVAHDLKGPSLNLDRLLAAYAEEAPGPAREYIVALLGQEVQRLTATVQGMMQVLHTQHGLASAVAEPVDLAEVGAQVAADLTALRTQHDGHLTLMFEAAPMVHFPRLYVESILRNLLSNAFKYRDPERAPRVTVRSARQGAAVVLTVTDNGRGIDLARHGQRLFEPFTRLTADGEGAGLGLHMLQTIVQQQGGALEVASTLGYGTTFTVTLPQPT